MAREMVIIHDCLRMSALNVCMSSFADDEGMVMFECETRRWTLVR